MRDSGLAAVYDRYADHLYTYCRFLLREPADAVDAVEDTFLVAVERLPGPPDDEWLRPWLFAVARNACLSRLKSGQAATALDETDGAGGAGGPGSGADRALLRAALRGLTPAERDVIGMLWHGLDIAEVALVLGIDRDAALARFSRARDRLELCVVTLVVVRAGHESCPGLSTLLGDWDGRLTVALARKLSRHVDHCPDCGARRREELRPSLLLSLTPGALLGAAVTDEALRRAVVPTRMLRRQALSAAADSSPEGAAVRGMACRRQGSFRENGFPKPLETEVRGGSRGRMGLAAAAVVVLVIAALAVAFASGGGGGQPSGAAGAGAGLDGQTRQSGGASVTTVGGTQPTRSGSPSTSPSASPSFSPSASLAPTPSATWASPTPQATSASPSPPSSPSAKATSAKPSPAATATLSVPSDVTLHQVQGQWPTQWQGSLTVTVSGGSLSWSLSGDNGLSFSRNSGTASATIAITGQGRGNFSPITVTGGGKTYTVDVTTHGGW